MKIGNAFRDQRPHAHHGKTSDFEVISDGAVSTDGCARTDAGSKSIWVGVGGAKVLEIGGRCAREPIISKNRSCADHDAFFDGHRGTDVYEGVDLDAISDHHVIGDVRLLTDDALFANTGTVPNMHVVPYGCTGTDPDVFFDDGCRMNAHSGMAG